MTNQGALEGVRVKLVKAHTHIQELKSAVDPLLDIDQDVIIRDTDSPLNEANFYIARVPAIELGFSAVVGDVLYSFRSGLDHLAHQLVLLDGQKPTLGTYFPIHESPKDKKGQQRKPNIQPGINRADILDALDAAQPYNQHPNRGALLSAVRDLGNIDKHRLLLAMVCALDFESGLIFWGKNHGDPDHARTVSILRDRRKRQNEERLRAGEAWENLELGFTDELGGIYNPDTFTRTTKRLADGAGVSVLGPHDAARHTWATLALSSGVHPKVVQEPLGHSSISITLDRYSRVIEGMDREAAETVAGLIR